MNTDEREAALTREILETIDRQSDVTQRHLADRLGVALGLANSYLKRCVRKGLIKIEQAPANRYLYYLTPRGFAEKSRLTAEYLSLSFDFYRRAGSSCTKTFRECLEQNRRTVIFAGISELAEIASLRAREQNIQVTGILDRNSSLNEYIGMPVLKSIEDAGQFDACVITAINAPDAMLAYLETRIPAEKVFVPDILGINERVAG